MQENLVAWVPNFRSRTMFSFYCFYFYFFYFFIFAFFLPALFEEKTLFSAVSRTRRYQSSTRVLQLSDTLTWSGACT